jgi:hypothetical protein
MLVVNADGTLIYQHQDHVGSIIAQSDGTTSSAKNIYRYCAFASRARWVAPHSVTPGNGTIARRGLTIARRGAMRRVLGGSCSRT